MFVDTQVRPQGEQVDAVAPAKLKLSQAIRIGAKIRPQCMFRWFSEGKSCAQGAAYEAVFGHPPGDEFGGCDKDPRFSRRLGSKLWDKLPNTQDIYSEIQHRNDHGESRESIADWLEAQGL